MKRFWIAPVLAVVGLIAIGRVAEAQKPPRLVEITVSDNMKFSVESIEAKPGETLKVRIKSTGTMPKTAMGHNFILLKPGVSALDVANAGMSHRDTDFIAPEMKDKIITSTTLVGPGETAETTFKAPAKPDTYTYFCSFPGHLAAGMKGSLVVK
jgi:azurin